MVSDTAPFPAYAPDPAQRTRWDRLWALLLAEPKEEAALESRPDDELVDNDDRSTY